MSLACLSMLFGLSCKGGAASSSESSDAGEAATGEASSEGGGNCGAAVCGDHEVCVDDADPPYCECDAAYTGDDCDACAPGYEDLDDDGECTPIQIDCDDAGICGLNGACIEEAGKPDRCECSQGYTGPTCGQCDDGWQDNDENGSCEQGCELAGLSCEAPLVCVDGTGAAECGCPDNTQGDDCEYCQTGFARIGDGACYQVCPLDCVQPGSCYDAGRTVAASCVCPPGLAGLECDVCAPDFSMSAAGVCVADTAPATHTLLMYRRASNWSALSAVDPVSGAFADLHQAPSGLARVPLAWDPAADVVYAKNSADPNEIFEVDTQSGAATMVGSFAVDADHLGWDPDANRLLSETKDFDRGVYVWDPVTLAGSEIDIPGLPALSGFGHQPGTDLVYAAATSPTRSVQSLDLQAMTATETGPLGSMTLGFQQPTFAIDPIDGTGYALAKQLREQDTVILERCRELAERLGYDYADAPGSVTNMYGGVVGSSLDFASAANGPELLVYRSYGGDGDPLPGQLRITNTNEDAFLCIFTYEEALEIHIATGATWTGGVISSYEPFMSATVNGAWSPTGDPLVVRAGAPADQSFEATPEAFRIMDTGQWSDRVLPGTTSFDDSSDVNAPVQLHTIDLATGTSTAQMVVDPSIAWAPFTVWRP